MYTITWIDTDNRLHVVTTPSLAAAINTRIALVCSSAVRKVRIWHRGVLA